MDSKIVDIDAELERDGIIQKVRLRFLLKPITVESGVVLRYEIDKGLGFTPGQRIGDGNCMLRYMYDGKKEDWKKYRVERGKLLAGWKTGN